MTFNTNHCACWKAEQKKEKMIQDVAAPVTPTTPTTTTTTTTTPVPVQETALQKAKQRDAEAREQKRKEEEAEEARRKASELRLAEKAKRDKDAQSRKEAPRASEATAPSPAVDDSRASVVPLDLDPNSMAERRALHEAVQQRLEAKPSAAGTATEATNKAWNKVCGVPISSPSSVR